MLCPRPSRSGRIWKPTTSRRAVPWRRPSRRSGANCWGWNRSGFTIISAIWAATPSSAAHVALRLGERLGIDITPEELLERPTIAELAVLSRRSPRCQPRRISLDVIDNTANIVCLEAVTFCVLSSLCIIQPEMKTAVLEFQRNRVRRQQSGAASLDIMKTIGELRSALQGIGKAIEAVERLAVAQAGEGASRPRRSVSPKKATSQDACKRKGRGGRRSLDLPGSSRRSTRGS